MSSFCGCLAKVKEFIGFNDQLIDASGLRRHTNPLVKKKDKTGWNLKQSKQSLKNTKRPASTMPASYSTPAIPDPVTRLLLQSQSSHFGKQLAKKVREAENVVGFLDPQELRDRQKRKFYEGLSQHKSKINFSYGNEKTHCPFEEKEGSEEKYQQIYEQNPQISDRKDNEAIEDENVINENSISVNDKIRVLEKRFIQEEKRVEKDEEQEKIIEIIRHQEHYFYEQKIEYQYLRAEEYIERYGIKEQSLSEMDWLKETNDFKRQNGQTFQQIYEISAENHESEVQVPTIQIFPHHHISVDYKHLNQQNNYNEQHNHTFRDDEELKALSSYLDQMSLTKSIHDGQSSNSISEVIERSTYNILSECNISPEHSAIIQPTPSKCFISMKLSHNRRRRKESSSIS